MTTDLYFLLDASGSMAGREAEVVNHFNEYLNKHKVAPEATYLSLATFEGDNFTWVKQWQPIGDVAPLTTADYRTGGITPLNDSVAKVLDVAEKNPDTGKLVIIVTDGFENASKDYPGVGNARLKARIAALDSKQWGVVYLGEGMTAHDAQAVADSLAVPVGNSASVRGMAGTFNLAGDVTSNYYSNRRSGGVQQQLTVKRDKRK